MRPDSGPESAASPLHQLAELAGVSVHWIDAYDQPQVVDDEALAAILTALQLPCATPDDCRASRALLERDHAVGRLPPLITGVQGQAVILPMHSRLHGVSCQVQLESGACLRQVISSDVMQPPSLPPIAEAGYHRLQVAGHDVVLAIAPPRCYTITDALQSTGHERGWALAAQLYGLRSGGGIERAGDGGLGHFTALAELAERAAIDGAAGLAMSPVHAMFAADPSRSSPYSPSSRLFLNSLHIDPAAVLGDAALAHLLAEGGDGLLAEHAALTQSPWVDWQRAGAHRVRLLRQLYGLFTTAEAPDDVRHRAFAGFKLAGGDALHAHALYEAFSSKLADAADKKNACDWRQWGDDGVLPGTPQIRAFAEEHHSEIDFHLFLQWQAAQGLAHAQQRAREAGMGIGLIIDLAVGADSGGSQAWSHQDDMATGLTVGAPPDLLAPQGQNWGLGAFSPLALQRTGYRAYLAMLRACFSQGGGLRIDHVLGLNRLWLVPQGREADAGAYVRYPLQDMLRLIALESWRHRSVVIGEDLGTVPPGFRETIFDAGVSGIQVLWFQQQRKHFLPPQGWSTNAIAVTTTHDLPTVAGWWAGSDIAWRARLDQLGGEAGKSDAVAQRDAERALLWQTMSDAGATQGETPSVAIAAADLAQGTPQETGSAGQDRHALADACAPAVDAAIQFVAQTPSPLAVIPAEDILGLMQQPNLPGLTEPHPNWRRRLPTDAAQLFDAPDAAERLTLLHRLRGTHGTRDMHDAPSTSTDDAVLPHTNPET